MEIVNCFSHCHLKALETQQPESPAEDPEEDHPLSVLKSRIRYVGFEVDRSATDFITADDQLAATGEAITDGIILNTANNPGTHHPVCAESELSTNASISCRSSRHVCKTEYLPSAIACHPSFPCIGMPFKT